MADLNKERQKYIQGLFIIGAVLLVFKALQIQVINDTYRSRADATAIASYTLYPSRGLIYDRNGKLLVNNNPMYDLMMIYNQIDKGMDTTKFCQLLGIDKPEFSQRINKDWTSNRHRKWKPEIFLSKISSETYARFQESLYEFPGFFIQVRNVRGYPYKNAAHLLGYLREVNEKEVKDQSEIYKRGDYIGASGLEKAYEKMLRGRKGVRYVLKDNLGRDVGPYKNETMDSSAVSGMDLVSTIDVDLQSYGEELMVNKRGAIIAIEPSSGEILAMVSTPSYDPNLLTINRNRGKAYNLLAQDQNKPLFDRSVMAEYPPGSLFKPVVSLIAMQEGLLDPDRTIRCQGAYYHNGQRLTGCHGHPTCFNVQMAIQHSCNAYFVTVFRDIIDQFGFYNPGKGLDLFNQYLTEFGLGAPLGLDFTREKSGNFPSADYYNNHYKEDKWNSVWIRSLAIGQGELLTTNLQLANLAAIIANKGFYYTPHLVKGFSTENASIDEKYLEKRTVNIDWEYFIPIIDGMEAVVNSGTARSAYISGIPVCGKTGTAENPHGADHSIFFAFAPKENPQIALAVYIENGGWGGSYAAPLTSLMIEKYLKGSISPNRKYREDKLLNANLIEIP